MLSVNYFGKSFIIDRLSYLVITTSNSNEIAKSVSSTLLDTFVIQIGDHAIHKVKPEWISGAVWAKCDINANFSDYTDVVPDEIIKKKEIALIRRKACYLLREQAASAGAVFDNLSDLSTSDILFYQGNKELYIKMFSKATGTNLETSERHLDFVCESLISAQLREKFLLWKHMPGLRKIFSEDDYNAWKVDLLRDTVTLGKV